MLYISLSRFRGLDEMQGPVGHICGTYIGGIAIMHVLYDLCSQKYAFG